jgi:hypothetical protein
VHWQGQLVGKKGKINSYTREEKSDNNLRKYVGAKERDWWGERVEKEMFNKAFALEQEWVTNEKLLLKVRKEEVELQKQRDKVRIMAIDVTNMPEDQKRYYMGLWPKIMSRQPMPST